MLFDNEAADNEYVPLKDFLRIRQVRINETVEATLSNLHVGNIDTDYLDSLKDATLLENQFNILLDKLEHEVNTIQEHDFIISEFAKLLEDEQKRGNA